MTNEEVLVIIPEYCEVDDCIEEIVENIKGGILND